MIESSQIFLQQHLELVAVKMVYKPNCYFNVMKNNIGYIFFLFCWKKLKYTTAYVHKWLGVIDFIFHFSKLEALKFIRDAS